jgi:hypothetical protein
MQYRCAATCTVQRMAQKHSGFPLSCISVLHVTNAAKEQQYLVGIISAGAASLLQ